MHKEWTENQVNQSFKNKNYILQSFLGDKQLQTQFWLMLDLGKRPF